MSDTLRSGSISTKLQRIAKLARKAPGMIFTSLSHCIDIDFLREAYRRTRKDGATGVDGRTAQEYGDNLEENLRSLLDRFRSGTYRAPPVRRVHIPKGDGSKTRPIGVPTFEDKVLQRAVTMLLESIYECDFLPCSYGFRPRKSAHDALVVLWQQVMDMQGGWVLEVDIKSFFDVLDHRHLRSFLDQRVCDGVLRRAIGKWLNAGVMEDGQHTRPATGSPQGGVISPLLANIYLHEVLDKWFEETVKPLMKGASFMVRYADDVVMVFADESDARRVFDVLPKRCGKYGLTLHPEKTRLVRFQRPRSRGPGKGRDSSGQSPGSFDLLGFRHFWGRSRRGAWVVKRRTTPSRFTRALKAVTEWCRKHRHRPIAVQQRELASKLRGHYGYYGITGNSYALGKFQRQVTRCWRRWLDRRSQHHRMPWERFNKLLAAYPLPPARCVHSTFVT